MKNTRAVTTREVVALIKNIAGVCKFEFNFFNSEDDFVDTAANAPGLFVVNSEKLRHAGIELTEVHEAIRGDLRNRTNIHLSSRLRNAGAPNRTPPRAEESADDADLRRSRK